MPFFGPVPAQTINTWAEHKRKQALIKLGLILYIWHKRGLSSNHVNDLYIAFTRYYVFSMPGLFFTSEMLCFW